LAPRRPAIRPSNAGASLVVPECSRSIHDAGGTALPVADDSFDVVMAGFATQILRPSPILRRSASRGASPSSPLENEKAHAKRVLRPDLGVGEPGGAGIQASSTAVGMVHHVRS